MSEKKTSILTIRLSDSEKEELMTFAAEQMTDASTLMRELAKKLLFAHRQHGENLIWPPKFDYIIGHAAGELSRSGDLDHAHGGNQDPLAAQKTA